MRTVKETFAIDFDGTAFDKRAVSASSIAQSLLALDALLRSISKQLYGEKTRAHVKIRSGSRSGSFFVDLSIKHRDEDPSKTGAAPVLKKISVVEVLKDLIRLNKFVFGKSAEPKDQSHEVIKISVVTDKAAKVDTDFRRQTDCALEDKSSEVLLTVVSPMLDGNKTGWRFSAGDDNSEFSADVEDDEFLRNVRNGQISWANGTSLLASMRNVQVKTENDIKTKRTVLQVKKVIQPLSSFLVR